MLTHCEAQEFLLKQAFLLMRRIESDSCSGCGHNMWKHWCYLLFCRVGIKCCCSYRVRTRNAPSRPQNGKRNFSLSIPFSQAIINLYIYTYIYIYIYIFPYDDVGRVATEFLVDSRVLIVFFCNVVWNSSHCNVADYRRNFQESIR